MNKGYTLIEIIAVIVILGFIMVLTSLNVTKYAAARAEKDYEKLKEIIVASAEIYADENDTILNKLSTVGSRCKLSYQKLIHAGLVDPDQRDPRTKIKLSEENYIVITVQSGYKLKYEFINLDNNESKTEDNVDITRIQNCQ